MTGLIEIAKQDIQILSAKGQELVNARANIEKELAMVISKIKQLEDAVKLAESPVVEEPKTEIEKAH